MTVAERTKELLNHVNRVEVEIGRDQSVLCVSGKREQITKIVAFGTINSENFCSFYGDGNEGDCMQLAWSCDENILHFQYKEENEFALAIDESEGTLRLFCYFESENHVGLITFDSLYPDGPVFVVSDHIIRDRTILRRLCMESFSRMKKSWEGREKY